MGSIWKVNRKTRKVKRVQKKYGSKSFVNVEKHAGYNKGMRQPDYFLVVPEEMMPSEEEGSLGILQMREIREDEEVVRTEVKSKLEIEQLIAALEMEGANVSKIGRECE